MLSREWRGLLRIGEVYLRGQQLFHRRPVSSSDDYHYYVHYDHHNDHNDHDHQHFNNGRQDPGNLRLYGRSNRKEQPRMVTP